MAFKRSEMEKVKIKAIVGLQTMEKKVPKFTGAEGIEGLLYTEERFRSACNTLEIDNKAILFNTFEDVVEDVDSSRLKSL